MKWLQRIVLLFALLLLPLVAFFLLLLATRGAYGGVLALGLLIPIVCGWAWLWRRRRPALVIAATLIPVVACAFVCVPVAPRTPPIEQVFDAAPTEFWQLSTGSNLAYYHLSATTIEPPKATILFLHGGPGSSVTSGHMEFFQRFTELGYDVYLYDQAGSGRSALLPTNEYSHSRNMADLAEVIERIDAPNLTLVGQSYGGMLAASAVADARTAPKISKAIFSEPGPIPMRYRDFTQYVSEHVPESDATNPRKQVEEISPTLLEPRMLVGLFALPQGNQFLPQEEAANVYDPAETEELDAYQYCTDEKEPVPPVTEKTGFRMNPYVTVAVNASVNADTNEFSFDAFQNAQVPAMLLLGECSYVHRSDQLAYISAYPKLERVQYFKDFGHGVLHRFDDGRDDPFRSILAFLEDAPAPLPNYPTEADFQEFVEAGK